MSDTIRLRSKGLDWRLIEGEIVAVDFDSSVYFGVNGSGAELWAALTHGATRDELQTLLVERFAIDPARAGQDVDGFLAALAQEGLLQPDAESEN